MKGKGIDLDAIKAKFTPEEKERYNRNSDEAKALIAGTSNPGAVSHLGGEIMQSLSGAELLGIIQFSDMIPLLQAMEKAADGLVIASKYIDEITQEPRAVDPLAN